MNNRATEEPCPSSIHRLARPTNYDIKKASRQAARVCFKKFTYLYRPLFINGYRATDFCTAQQGFIYVSAGSGDCQPLTKNRFNDCQLRL
jgi:hypothetical protein